jgi:SAM-dependent methyltransferase
MYDKLAPNYQNYAAEKSNYINAIDQLIIQKSKGNVRTMLDVGSADGMRGIKLSKEIGVESLVLAEPSQKMVELCKKIYNGEIWAITADNLPETRRFDLITCLWNVLGHIQSRDTRVTSLKRMYSLLNPGGKLFLDVNNRYNSNAYGFWEICSRIIYDFFNQNNNKGDTDYDLHINGETIKGMGHLFTPQEMKELLNISGINRIKRYSVDYKTGKVHSSFLYGQLLFEIERESK